MCSIWWFPLVSCLHSPLRFFCSKFVPFRVFFFLSTSLNYFWASKAHQWYLRVRWKWLMSVIRLFWRIRRAKIPLFFIFVCVLMFVAMVTRFPLCLGHSKRNSRPTSMEIERRPCVYIVIYICIGRRLANALNFDFECGHKKRENTCSNQWDVDVFIARRARSDFYFRNRFFFLSFICELWTAMFIYVMQKNRKNRVHCHPFCYVVAVSVAFRRQEKKNTTRIQK